MDLQKDAGCHLSLENLLIQQSEISVFDLITHVLNMKSTFCSKMPINMD